MKIVSPLLKRLIYPCLAAGGYYNRVSRPGLAVVTYHGVLPPRSRSIDPGFDGSLITAQKFRQQLRLLKTKYSVISPEEMHAWCRKECELPPRAALLTCDDGFLSCLTEIVPILQEEGLRCLFFVTGASVNEQRTMLWYEELFLLLMRAPAGSFRISSDGIEIEGSLRDREQRRIVWWGMVQRLSQIEDDRRSSFLELAHAHFGLERSLDHYLATYPEAQRHFCLLNRNELLQLADAGMTIGAHTLTHPILAQMKPELAWSEIVEGRSRLEAALGKRVWAFAYPFGDDASISPEVVAMAKRAGFAAAFVNTGGGLGADLPLHAIPRVHVNADMNLTEFEAHVSGLYGWLRKEIGRPVRSEAPLFTAVQS